MEVITLFPDGFASNCYIIHNGTEAFVIDPSVPCKKILCELEDRKLTLVGILLTHGHFDHIFSADALREATGVPLFVHEADAEMLTDSHKNAYAFFFGEELTFMPPQKLLLDGDTIPLGEELIKVIHTPGHSLGSVCYDIGDKLITGDTVFAESFGRYDLYGGDRLTLAISIKALEELSKTEDKIIYPGHGERAMLRGALNRIKLYF